MTRFKGHPVKLKLAGRLFFSDYECIREAGGATILSRLFLQKDELVVLAGEKRESYRYFDVLKGVMMLLQGYLLVLSGILGIPELNLNY
jgi:hypothetical protein|nr:MAG TPA: hypothetical protein [Caudoviricetes sp.]